jgi:ubiquitin C-terminal hydrolase
MEHCRIPISQSCRVSGLSNPGNACFLNVAVQLLRAVAALRFLAQTHPDGRCLRSLHDASTASRLLDPQKPFWQVVELYLGYTPRAVRQNCACEFLRFFLVSLDEELEGLYQRPVHDDADWVEVGQRNTSQSFNFRARGKSVIYDLIGLCLKSELRAKGHSSVSYQEELVVALQVAETLTGSLERYFESCRVEDVDVGGVRTGAQARTLVSSFAPYLIFHVQRFSVQQGRVSKKKVMMQYPRMLKLPEKYFAPGLRLAVQNGQCLPPEYELKAVVEHHGENAHSGHYTIVLQSVGGWVLADDHLVRPVSADYAKSRMAYVLLYQQVNREYL